MNVEQIPALIVNPAATARKNCENSDTYTARYQGSRFTKLSADKGMGRFLLAIYHNPGLTKKKLFEIIFGNKPHAAFAETFTIMKGAKIIYNEKGYYITNLGICLLKQFKLL